MTKVFAAIAVIGSLALALWKWYVSKEREKRKIVEKGKDAIKNGDTSKITSIFGRLKR